jgi:hypothetical protein
LQNQPAATGANAAPAAGFHWSGVVATPRVAFAEPSAGISTERPARFTRAFVTAACAAEVAVAVPTILVELQLQEDYWALCLRLTIALVRLSPLLAPLVLYCQQFFASLTLGRQAHCQRLVDAADHIGPAIFCPEVRWGVAITLDMWYLLSTPLNKGLTQAPPIILLICNVLLCFGDTVMLIMMLASKGDDPPEEFQSRTPGPLIDTACPCPQIFSSSAAAHSSFDPTCIICLGDFQDGDEVVQLPCNHTFHEECIGHWLVRSRRCPLRCPQLVLPPGHAHQAHWNMHMPIRAASGVTLSERVPTAVVLDVTASDHVSGGRSPTTASATTSGSSLSSGRQIGIGSSSANMSNNNGIASNNNGHGGIGTTSAVEPSVNVHGGIGTTSAVAPSVNVPAAVVGGV